MLKRFRLFCIIFVCTVLITVAVVEGSRAREAARQSACAHNLKQLAVALLDFALEHNQIYPPIDNVKGNLIFEGDYLTPEYLSDLAVLKCPGDSAHASGATSLSDITSPSYIYLGWVVTNEKEGLAAIAAYLALFRDLDKNDSPPSEREDEPTHPELILTEHDGNFVGPKTIARSLGRHLLVAEGDGNLGGKIIYRLTAYSDVYGLPPELWHPEIRYPSAVPVIWEWPGHHSPAGGNVLYLDGHVEFVEYPGKFPMTKEFIEALSQFQPSVAHKIPPGTQNRS